MKKVLGSILGILLSIGAFAQQVPNAGFEDWSGTQFDGNVQPASWNASNVTQFGFKFNFAHRESGHTGSYSMMVQDQDIGAAGITETSPGYFSLGQPWVYIASLTQVSQASAGTTGGITWAYRPDTMVVWIKRTGNNTDKEDFHLLYYSWYGTAQSSKYKGKNGSCTSVSKTDEESDIRQATDANECGTDTKATQVAEGWWRERKTYSNWTEIRVPIYYANNSAPTKMNIIFSASNYPAFRANSGLYAGNSLYVDDIHMVYSSKIQHLYIDDKEWLAFDPNETGEQVYSLGQSATSIPTNIKARRGEGKLTNIKNQTASFPGRELSGSEIQITNGQLDGAPTMITVTAEDGSSTTVYKIKFVKAASNNANLASIQVNGTDIPRFNPYVTSYTVDLPYGTTTVPTVSAVGQEPDKQVINITQPTSITGTSTITVMAADKHTTNTYTLNFRVAALADNTLQNILVNGAPLPGFTPLTTNYRVSLPLGTTQMPSVQAVSAYPAGQQTIVYTAPSVIDGGTYQIAVTTPGNPTPKTYKLNFKLEASTYSKLADIQVGGESLEDFDPERTTYYITLPIGTTALPAITWAQGDQYQTVSMADGGIDGTTRITVTAANGDQTVYKLIFSTEKSEISTLDMIYLDGVALDSFSAGRTSYRYELPIGTTQLPVITYDKSDEYEQVNVITAGLNGNTRITVTAGNGNTTLYTIQFSVRQATDASLHMIYLDGTPLDGFQQETLEYWVNLPQGTTVLPTVTYDQADEYQSVTARAGGLNGDYKLVVRPQTGASRTYIIHFSVATSSNNNLTMIYLDGIPLEGFDPQVTSYVDSLGAGISTLPTVTYDKGESSQKVLSVVENTTQTIKVTAQSGAQKTYTILFVLQKSESAFLDMIYLDSVALSGFDASNLIYDSLYLRADGRCPVITVDKEEGQQVTIAAPYGAGTAKILVRPEVGAPNTYMLHFVDTTAQSGHEDTTHVDPYVVSTDATLQSILVDGAPLIGFNPNQLSYTINMVAGSLLPAVTYVANNEHQHMVAGYVDRSHFNILVTAENGDTATYRLTMNIAKYDNANLQSLSLSDRVLSFNPNQYDNNLTIDDGADLPQISIIPTIGQSTMIVDASDDHQQVIVTAESGRQNIYNIRYTRVMSSNALLADILLNGVSMAGFNPTTFSYVDTLEWRTEVIPSIHPVGQLHNQIITTRHSRVNGIATIHVEASDGVTAQDYTIYFPTRKSSNTKLEDVMIDHEEVTLKFKPAQLVYNIELPVGDTVVPAIIYEKGEPEQSVQVVARPLGQTSELIVHAEDGTTASYQFTFTAKQPTQANILKRLTVKETEANINLKTDPARRDFEVTIPFGSRSFTLDYEKNFATQTVWIQNGGVNHPTIITVKSNRPGEADEIYTVTPVVDQNDPATLTDIKVNGTTIAGFTPERFTYIVNVNARPVLRYTLNKGADINIIEQSTKHWKAEVSYGDRTNVYEVWYYYNEEQVPNAEFTNWSAASVYTSAQKPTGWKCVADALGKHSGFGSFTPDVLCVKSGTDAVKLVTTYSVPGGGHIPGVLTLGNVSGKWGVAGSTNISISGGIPFHNSPDQMKVRYYSDRVFENNIIRYSLTGSNGAMDKDFTDASSASNYKEVAFDLSEVNDSVGDPTLLNITFSSYNALSGTIAATIEMTAKYNMYVDWVHFIYNKTLTGLKVNGVNATMSGKAFTVNLSDPEAVEKPQLTFFGEVADQAQKVTWSAETKSGNKAKRTASIINYAENGDSETYSLEVYRPLDTKDYLNAILVDTVAMTSFVPSTYDYTIQLGATQTSMPDLMAIPASSRQTITTSYADSTYTIVVTPESGAAKTYTVRFYTAKRTSTKLMGLGTAAGLTPAFNPDVKNYTITAEQMPMINFAKGYDAQTVDVHDGVLTVTAESGATDTYRISMVAPTYTTSGQLLELELDGVLPADFASTTYTYTKPRPASSAFRRVDERDSVVMVQNESYMEWQVLGTTPHTYRVNYETSASTSTQLAGIYVNGEMIEGFSPMIYDYIITTDSTVDLQVLGQSEEQEITITHTTNYVINVKAGDGTMGTTPYTVTVNPVLTDNAQLSMITLDGEMLPNFSPDQYTYVVTLPTPAAKLRQPRIPTIDYVLGDKKQTVTVEAGLLGESTYLNVTAADGFGFHQYNILIQAEPSHNSDLLSISVDGVPVDRFEPGRHYYSVWANSETVPVTYQKADSFATVQEIQDGLIRTLRVTAEDGTIEDYTIELFVAALSTDATLSEILLDGEEFKHFQRTLNPKLDFAPMQNLYRINLPSGSQMPPQVSAVLNSDGQTVNITSSGMNVYLEVTAKDGVTTNTYTLEFLVPMSSNAHLKAIYLDGVPMSNFDSETTYYMVELPVGTHTLPEIFGEKDENTQTVDDPVITGQKATIDVTAEDGVTTMRYTILFSFLLSDNDTLNAIYADGILIEGFTPSTYYYSYELPVGSTVFPAISWEEGDEWQTISQEVIREDALSKVVRVNVMSESGLKTYYTITYDILLSTVDTLQMIYVDNKPLAGFDPYKSTYTYQLANGTTEVPLYYYIEGDAYQTVVASVVPDSSMEHSLGQRLEFQVTAENGMHRTYTIYFPVTLSDNAQLSMIWYGGQELPNFDEGRYSYRMTLPYGTEHMSSISVTKKEAGQNVDINIQGDTLCAITVTAEDGFSREVYTIRFEKALSPNADLGGIFLDGVLLEGFRADSMQYNLSVPKGEDVPEITVEAMEEGQEIDMASYDVTVDGNRLVTYLITVISPDGNQSKEYTLMFTFAKSNISTLTDLRIGGKTLSVDDGWSQDFNSDSTYYQMFYPIGSVVNDFYSENDLEYVLADTSATVQITSIDINDIALHIRIVVTAENEVDFTCYDISQTSLLSSNNFIKMIYFDDKPMEGFHPEDTCIVYYLFEGQTPPEITYELEDTLAIGYSVTPGEVGVSPWIIIVDAQDGMSRRYSIYFQYSDINTSEAAFEGDVLVQRVPNSMDVVFAALRTNISVGIYKMDGHMLFDSKVEESDPNNVMVENDGNGREKLVRIYDISNAPRFTLDPNELYFYVFFRNGKERIASGRLMIVR